MDADQPFILRTSACANIYLDDNVIIDSKAENIYCTDLAGFKIHALPKYNAHADNKIVTLKFDEVGENNVAVWGTTNAQMFKLVSKTHSLRVGTELNANNLVMYAGVTLNVFSATVKGGYVYATCGFLDDRISAYEVYIGTSVNTDESLEGEKKMTCETADSLRQFVAKIALGNDDVGKRVIQLRYTSVENKRAIATLLITILKTDVDGNLTGEMDFGALGAGDTLKYKKEDGSWADFNGNIPNDALINSENQIELKYTPEGGESFIFNAEAAERVDDIASGIDPLTGKLVLTDHSITVETTEGFEYRLTDTSGNVIEGCSWTGGSGGKVIFSGLDPDTEYVVEAHIKGTPTKLPSKSVSATVTTLTNAEHLLLEESKAAAKKELDNTAAAENAKIDAMTGLTSDEIAAAKDKVAQAVTDGKADIDGKNSVADVTTARDSANAAIEKVTTDEAKKIISDYATEIKTAIDNSGLSDSEKTAAKDNVDTKVTAANNAVDSATDSASLNTAITDGKSDLFEEFKAAAKKDLESFIAGITDPEITDLIDTAITDITAAADKKTVHDLVAAAKKEALAQYKEDAKAAIDAIYADLTHKNVLSEELESAKAAIDKADSFDSIDNAEADGILTLQKEDAKARLDKYIGNVDESFTVKVIADAKAEIDNATTNNQIGEIADRAETDAFDAYKSAKMKELTDYYDALIGSGKYSDAGLAELASIYKNNIDGAWNNLNSLTQSDGFKAIDEKLAEGKNRLDAVKITAVGSGGVKPNEDGSGSGSEYEYPDDKKDDALAGKIESTEGMNSNIELQIKKENADNKKKMENAVKNGQIKGASGNLLTDKDAVALLKDKELKATFNVKLVYNNNGQITLVPNQDLKGSYTVKILLPQDMRNIQNLQIIYIDDDGNVEVFDTERMGNYIVFTTTHFSSYLILGEPVLNLWWLIILLIVVILLEILFILLWHLVFSKRLDGNKNERSNDGTNSNDETNSNDGNQKNKASKAYSIAPIALLGTIIVPSGGMIAIIILALAVLGLGAYIVYMLIKTLFKKAENNQTDEETACVADETVATTPSAVPLSLFRLSRQDVLEHIEVMAANKKDFPVLPFTKERLNVSNCDSFRCGALWSFGVLFESKTEVLKFMLRLDKDYAQSLSRTHCGITETEFGGGKEWYKIIINDTFTSKKQVFDIIDAAYFYVFQTRYTFDEDTKEFVTDESKAEKDEETFAEVLKGTQEKDDELMAAEAEAENRSILMLSQLTFKPLKKEIAEKSRDLCGEGVQICERANFTKTGLALADTYYSLDGMSDTDTKKKICFMYVYQLKNDAIQVILKISKTLADTLMEKHPSLCRSKFPKGKDWYTFNVDGSFPSMDSLTDLVTAAKDFVNTRSAQ